MIRERERERERERGGAQKEKEGNSFVARRLQKKPKRKIKLIP
jgi:hypothetical protein